MKVTVEFDSLEEFDNFRKHKPDPVMMLGPDDGRKPFSTPSTAPTKPGSADAWPFPDEEAVERKNVSPGNPTIGKIGTATTDELIAILNGGKQPPKNRSEHMKLLWKRGLVKYDGKEYYL
jgi:hypothetical protein